MVKLNFFSFRAVLDRVLMYSKGDHERLFNYSI
jgi:hypothetical protein